MTVDAARVTRRRATSKKAGAGDAPETSPTVTPEPSLDLSLEPPRSAVPPAPPALLAPTSTWSAAPSRRPMVAPGSSLAIGEIDQTVFDCPSCARPLALGARRCPGCGTRLMNGVAMGKAARFVALGLAVGLAAGVGGGAVLGLSLAQAAAPAAEHPAASALPNAGAGPSTAPVASSTPTITAPPVQPDVPPAARAAMGQALAMTLRLQSSREALREALAVKPFDASAVAQTLRSISADSVFAEQLAGRVATWPGAGSVATELTAFYAAIHDTAAEGLVASVRNETAYRSAATAMVELLSEAEAIDASVRSAAAAAGFTLPEPQPVP